MHPKIVEFVSGIVTVVPPAMPWQVSFDSGILSVRVGDKSIEKEKGELMSSKPDRFGRQVALNLMKTQEQK